MRRISLPQSWQQRALVITDVTDPESWFTEDELAVAYSHRLPQRQQQWMLSRIAAKQLARDRGQEASLQLKVERSTALSFSHSHGFGAAAMDAGAVGIDVERLRTIDDRAAHLFLSAEEEEAMRACRIAERLLHFWCAKEAAWKQLGGSVTTLKQVPLRLLEVSESGLQFDRAETWATNEVVVALTTS